MSSTRSAFSADFAAGEPSAGPLAPRRRGSLTRFLITFCIGVGATLGWQSYGDAAREIIANSYPQLGWLAPQAAVAQTVPDTVAPPAPSPDSQDLKAMSVGLAAVRQRVDQFSAQLAASQEQMTREITKLQAAEQDILQKISALPPRPEVVQARKPAPAPVPPVR
jgi:hypothetical protein